MNTNSKSQYLDVLQLFRGFAALMVVLHHSISSLKYYHKIEYTFLNYIDSIGKYGLNLQSKIVMLLKLKLNNKKEYNVNKSAYSFQVSVLNQ